MRLKAEDVFRYVLWAGVAYTANANRKYFGLPTTWVFHITLNSTILLLPELVRAFESRDSLMRAGRKDSGDLDKAIRGMMRDAVAENPNYGPYVAPLALAYMVSHPRFNIYKGDWGRLRLFGFGLDALPHSMTALGFTLLVGDALAAFRRNTPANARWRRLAEKADENAAWIAGSLLVGASAAYELGEYSIHNEELRETGGDESRINMEWSARDTVFDLIANTVGWLVGAKRILNAEYVMKRGVRG